MASQKEIKEKLAERARKKMERLQRLRQNETRKRLAMKKRVGGR